MLNFSNLVVHRIGLMMFKFSKDLDPLPIVELFIRNYEFIRQNQSLHTVVRQNQNDYRIFSFHGNRIWN